MQWTYIDDYGRRYRVGLYHGDRSGHLMVYCNSRVLVIDFNVLTDKKYSFLINDDLLDLHVERQNNKFAYAFEVDKKANTPGNRRRRKLSKRHLVQSLLFAAALILALAVVAFFMLGGMQYF